MKCERLTLSNFCNHRFRVVEFHEGTTAIIGPNGAGKSHILGGIRFALTGENPNVGTKLSNVYDQITPTEASYVELLFSHGGVTATVRRNIKPARPAATLNINNGAEIIEGDTDVTARITNLIGISTDILNDIVIVAQDEIFGFLDKTPAKRAEQFQRLFQTEQAAVIYRAIGDHLKSVQIPEIGGDRDAVVRMLGESQVAERTVSQLLQTYPGFDEIQKQRQLNHDVIAASQQWFSVNQQLQLLQQQQVARLATVATMRDELIKLEQQYADLRKQHDTQFDTVAAAKAALINAVNIKRQAEVRSQLCSKLMMLQQQLHTVIGEVPQLPVNYQQDIKVAQTTAYSISLQIDAYRKFINSFSNGEAMCPTCGTPTTVLGDKLAAANAALPALLVQYDNIRDAIELSQQYDKFVTTQSQEIRSLSDQITATQQQLTQFGEPQPVTDLAEFRTVVDEANKLRALLDEYDHLVRRAGENVAGCEGQLEATEAQIAYCQNQLRSMPQYTADQQAQAASNVQLYDKAASDRRKLEIDLATHQADSRRLQEQLTAIDQVKVEAEVRRSWHSVADNLRAVFHKDAAPRFVAQKNLERLQITMNEILSLFDTPFRVNADEGLSFSATFVSGSVQPAERLSGGQKVVLALAFRLALNLMFAENIGALYLDEPTAWLDSYHIRGFEPVLQQLSGFSASRGLQTIIITHEEALAPLFDEVVQL